MVKVYHTCIVVQPLVQSGKFGYRRVIYINAFLPVRILLMGAVWAQIYVQIQPLLHSKDIALVRDRLHAREDSAWGYAIHLPYTVKTDAPE